MTAGEGVKQELGTNPFLEQFRVTGVLQVAAVLDKIVSIVRVFAHGTTLI